MLNTHDQAVMDNYRMLACEIVLKAHNDLALALIDLRCMENPTASKFSADRCDYLLTQCKLRAKRVNRYALRNTPADKYDAMFANFVKKEIARKVMWRESLAKMCRLFLLEEDSLVQMLDLDGENIVRHAEYVADRWVETGVLRLKKSVRAENFDKWTTQLEEKT